MVNDDNDVDDDDDDIVVDMITRDNAVKSLSGEESRQWWIISNAEEQIENLT